MSCIRILLFHTSPVPSFYGEFSEQVNYHCHLLQIQLSPFHVQLYIFLPWLISCCHNLSLFNSQLGHIFNVFHISSLKLSCFSCTDNQHNLTQQSLQNLPLQSHLPHGLKKKHTVEHRFSWLFFADDLLIMKITLVGSCCCSQQQRIQPFEFQRGDWLICQAWSKKCEPPDGSACKSTGTRLLTKWAKTKNTQVFLRKKVTHTRISSIWKSEGEKKAGQVLSLAALTQFSFQTFLNF